MSYSGDAAEQVVRMSLETGEVAVRLAGLRGQAACHFDLCHPAGAKRQRARPA